MKDYNFLFIYLFAFFKVYLTVHSISNSSKSTANLQYNVLERDKIDYIDANIFIS